MAYVITEPCIGTKDTACVDVCPVDCIHPRTKATTTLRRCCSSIRTSVDWWRLCPGVPRGGHLRDG